MAEQGNQPPLRGNMRHVLAAAAKARALPTQGPIRPIEQPNDIDLDKGYWYGFSPAARARPARPAIDRPINILPTAEREPESFPPNMPAWVNTNCPPWVCPPFWSTAVSLEMSACLPFYEEARLLESCFEVPQDYVLVIKGISYEALNAVQFDVFQFDFLIDGAMTMSIEDMLIDTAIANQARRYALAGHFRQMPTHLVVDRNHTLCVRATLRGAIDLAGVSPNFPGQPIVSSDCQMKVFLSGWLANLRDNVDGGPRPTDLGDGGGLILPDVQGGMGP